MIDLLKDFIAQWCKLFGCDEDAQNYVIFLVVLLGILLAFLKGLHVLGKYYFKQRNKRFLNNNIHHYSELDIQNYTSNYIKQYFQIVSPAIEEEPNPKFVGNPRDPIIKQFLKIFEGVSRTKYFIILAGAGMGKTAFFINLYLKYLNRPQYFFSKPKSNIVLLPLGLPGVLEKMKGVEDKRNTILLLDALDEDVEALKDYESRMNLLLGECKDFKKILMTCRTQFFASEAEEPYDTNDYTFGEQGQYKFQKLYLSYFNQKDINKYLYKKFGIFRFRLISKSKKIIKKSSSLFVRPMLLSHIEDLVNIKKENINTLDIYQILIDKWLIREGGKYRIADIFGSIENYKKILFNFSKALAYKMYQDRSVDTGFFLDKYSDFKLEIEDDLIGSKMVSYGIQELEEEFLDKNNRAIKSKSLLNRDTNGNYKFSHKSILEYFLALNLIEDESKFYNFEFSAFDLVETFIIDFHFDPLPISLKFKFHGFNRELYIINHIKTIYLNYQILFIEKQECYESTTLVSKINIEADCIILMNTRFYYIYLLIIYLDGHFSLKENILSTDEMKKEKLVEYIPYDSLNYIEDIFNYYTTGSLFDAISKTAFFDFSSNNHNIYKKIKQRFTTTEGDFKLIIEEPEYFSNFRNYINTIKEIEEIYPNTAFYY